MNWTEILNDSNLLYASERRDGAFRKLRLREQLYNVRYYLTYQLTALDSTIIETLQFNGGQLNDLVFAEILGFNVVDDLNQKRYADPAEKEIFDKIIKEVSEYGLVSEHDHTITLQPLGYRALADGVKYEFHQGYKPLMEFFDLLPKDGDFNKSFPFYSSLGLETPLRDSGKLNFAEFNDTDILNSVLSAKSKLIERFNLQSATCPNIFEATESDGEFIQEKRLHEISADFRIFLYERKVYPVVFYNEQPCDELNAILWNGDNEDFLQEKRLQGLYHYTVRKTTKPLNLQNLKPYYNYWQIAELISNERYVWSDEALFELVQEKSSGNDWGQISKLCPLPDLYKYIPRYKEMWDWTVLSFRCEDDFVTYYITELPWDFEILSAERSIEFIKPLIIRADLVEKDWDWDVIVPQLDIPFIIQNLFILDIDLTHITAEVLESYPQSLLDYSDKKWDWIYITKEAPLEFILSNLNIFGTSLILSDLVDRVFQDSTYAAKYCKSRAFSSLVTEAKLYSAYNANQKDFSWSPTIIDWLEEHHLVHWKSSPNMVGLECNPFLVWNTAFFEHYKQKEFSPEGWEYISQSITSTEIVLSHLSLAWDWNILSKRDIVISDYHFIVSTHHLLNWESLLPELSGDTIGRLYEDGVLFKYMLDAKIQQLVTEAISRDIIIRHISDNWDWKILTRRFCSSLNIENFGKPQWIDKWDWDYLSENFDCEIIKEKIDLYVDRWNWTALTNRLGRDYILANLPEYVNYWNWKQLINEVLEPNDLRMDTYLPMVAACTSALEDDSLLEVWADITSRLSTVDAVEMISKPLDRTIFQFNYINIYNRRDFVISEYLDNCAGNRRIYIDWKALSRSRALNSALVWDKKIVKDFKVWVQNVIGLLTYEHYAWDFKYLSQQTSINWCDTILKIRSDEWDWDYICEHSSLFRGPKNIVKHINDLSNYINFDILSDRTDLNLNSTDFEKVAGYPWTWSKLSKNPSVCITTDFVVAHEELGWDWYDVSSRKDFSVPFSYIFDNKERNWNWEAISRNKDIFFDIQKFAQLLDKNWDWDSISRRNDFIFTEKVVLLLHNYPLNWSVITKSDNFEVTVTSVSMIPHDEVSWDVLSTKPDLSYDFLVKFKDSLDWNVLTKTASVDVSDNKYLDEFYDYLDWNFISKSNLFKITKENLSKYKYYLDWKQISRRPDFEIGLVDDFEDYIDWSYFSRATQIKLTPEIIEKYAERWDWIELAQNINFAEQDLHDFYETKLNIVKFYQHIREVKSDPAIYHFSHMFNAIEIIRSRKILSRNRAQQLGLLKYDAAGSVVNRTSKAHPYARFYFRTGTQTQFYNECLGRQLGDRYYNRAEKNGLPMCPMPVFFKFDLQEVLMTYGEVCCYSTGNMQSSSACVKRVVKYPHGLTVETLFSQGHSKEEQEKRQQEFLIPDEFDFSRLKNYQIICYNRTQREILESMFEGDPICAHFVSIESTMVEDVFLQENPRLDFQFDGDQISISTNYQGDYHFQITGEDLSSIRVGERKNTIQDHKSEISFKNRVNIEQNGETFEIYYICDNPSARSKKWLIYKQ